MEYLREGFEYWETGWSTLESVLRLRYSSLGEWGWSSWETGWSTWEGLEYMGEELEYLGEGLEYLG